MYEHPRHKKDTRTYEWNLFTIVESFEFLLEDKEATWNWVSKKKSTLAYIAGVLDAEGSIGIYSNGSRAALQALFYNTGLELLNFKSSLVNLGYTPLGPYLDKEKGAPTAKYGILRKKDYWKLTLARFAQVQDLLKVLPLRHPERIGRRRLALSVTLGQSWSTAEPQVRSIRTEIRLERDNYVLEAEMTCRKTHNVDSSVGSEVPLRSRAALS